MKAGEIYDMEYLTEEMYRRFQSIEEGEVPPPYIVHFFLPFGCPLDCNFCGIRVYRRCGKDGYAPEMDYIAAMYLEEIGIATEENLNEAREYAMKDEEKIRSALEGSGIDKETVEYIDYLDSKSDMVHALLLPYIALAEIKKREGITERQHILLSAYIQRKVSRIVVMEAMDFVMPLEYYLKIVDEAADVGVSVISIGGFNEPFANPAYLKPIMERVKARGLRGTIMTSGYVVDNELLKKAVEIDWDELSVSVDGASRKTTASLRGRKDYWDRFVEFISTVEGLKKEMGSDKPVVNLEYILNKRNYREIPDILRWAEEHDIGYVHFMPMWLYTHESFEEAIYEDDVEEFRSFLLSRRNAWQGVKVGNNVRHLLELEKPYVPSFWKEPPSYRSIEGDLKAFTPAKGRDYHSMETGLLDGVMCPSPWFQICFENRGGAKICPHHFVGYTPYNIMEHHLKDIWKSNEYALIRKNFLEKRYPHECREYCVNYPPYYAKKLLAEYQEMKRILNTTKPPPRPIKWLLRAVDSVGASITGKRSFARWLLSKGIRLYEPW